MTNHSDFKASLSGHTDDVKIGMMEAEIDRLMVEREAFCRDKYVKACIEIALSSDNVGVNQLRVIAKKALRWSVSKVETK